MPSLYFGSNDHSLQLIGLRNSSTHAYDNGATVQGRVLDGPEGAEIGGLTWPLVMPYVDPLTDTVGGEASGPTVVKSVSELDLTVTVGTTTALALAAGRYVRVLHSALYWRVIVAASGAVGADVVLHLEPVSWPIPSGQTELTAMPIEVTGTIGEIVEIIDGTYSATLDKALLVVKGQTYYPEVTAVSGSLDGQFLLKVKGVYRLP